MSRNESASRFPKAFLSKRPASMILDWKQHVPSSVATLNLAEAAGFATGNSDNGSCNIWAMGLVCVKPLP